jgi:hypothetical protein
LHRTGGLQPSDLLGIGDEGVTDALEAAVVVGVRAPRC